MTELSVLVPAYNEAASILQTVSSIHACLSDAGITHEILVINDGSQDNTSELAAQAGATVIDHPANAGYGHSLKTGLYHARYEWCAIIDADGTYPAGKLKEFVDYIPHFDMVVGARLGQHYWGSASKRLGRLLLGSLVAYITGRHVPDINSGMRLFRKSIALAHIRRISSGFSFTTTLTLAMLMESHFVKYIPIEYYKRAGKSKVRILPDSLRMLQILSIATLYYNPLKLFLPISVAALGVGAIFALGNMIWGDVESVTWVLLGLGILSALLVGGIGFAVEAIRLHRLSLAEEVPSAFRDVNRSSSADLTHHPVERNNIIG